MRNILHIKKCYGCGVCATVCAKNIIAIELNSNGFYEPSIKNLDLCTNCGLCTAVCSFIDEKPINSNKVPLHSYAAWSNDKHILRKCSSGGIGFEIGKQLLEQGYKVCGVKYNADKKRAEHYIASNINELIPSIGSKYIQSYTPDGFKAINKKERYLVTGTPCQIDSFRRYIRKFKVEENFILLDFFCHSVPSMWAWRKYLKMVERKTGKVCYASWRNKFTGWHDSWAMSIDGEKTGEKINWHDSYNMLIRGKKGKFNSRLSQGDIFYKLFLGDFCCNPACQKNCKFKYNSSSADIRIGDLWGKTYKNNEDGVSALVGFTEEGINIIKTLKGCTLIEHPFETVAEGQMKRNAGKALSSPIIMHILRSNAPINKTIIKSIFLFERVINKVKHIINK